MTWNETSDLAIQARASEASYVKRRKAGSRLLIGGAIALLLSYNRAQILPEDYLQQAGLFGNALAITLLVSGLSNLVLVRQLDPKAVGKNLSANQKELFGILSGDGKTPPVQEKPAQKKSPLPPLGLPVRNAKPITPTSNGRQYNGTPYTPQSASSFTQRESPYSVSPLVTTPEQLKPYLVPFEAMSGSPSDRTENANRESDGRQQYTPLFPGNDDSVQHYRPSLQLRGVTGSPLRPDAALYPSSSDAYQAVLKRLQADENTMNTWVDRLREWLAEEVFKPLLGHMRAAHLEVANISSSLGCPRIELSDLSHSEVLESSRGVEADEEAQLGSLNGMLLNASRSNLTEAQKQEVGRCLQAVQRYQGISKILRGEKPSGLIPPVPRGYIASRVKELARGPCLEAFTWNGGGQWRGRSWSTELLTDSALVFYIFAAFMEAPGWYFPIDGEISRNVASPLYIGSLPVRPASCCVALLPVRPSALPPESTAILALSLATSKPQFTLVLECKPALTTSNYRALFIHLLLLLQSCKLNNFGLIGNNNLKFLKLDRVLKPADSIIDVVKSKWYSLW